MSAHTPGPWTVSFQEGDSAPGIEGAAASVVIYGASHEDDVGVLGSNLKQRMANASLIAAAPELLEACNSARRYDMAIRGRAEAGDYRENAVDAAIAEGHDLDALYADWSSKALAAIVKADGK